MIARLEGTAVVEELCRLEDAGYVGLLGIKYLSPNLTAPAPRTGNRVTFININPAKGWAIVAWGPPDGEVKHKFLKDSEGQWHYDGVEKMEAVH
jgi:hypothetical protein